MSELEKPLIIFELANNHFGSVSHGKLIIETFSKFISNSRFQFAIKFQYRNLDTLIDEKSSKSVDNHFIKRFTDTKLSDEQFLELKNFAISVGFLTICTPFDEISAHKVAAHGYDYVKIASASLTDWPLLEAISKLNLPVIASTAGASLLDLRRSVTFLSKRTDNFSLMHCVAKYPTSNGDLQLDRIDFLKKYYRNIRIGYSAHEDPNNYTAVSIAYAKGAKIFEKHVGLEENNYKNNSYSCTPDQIQRWINSLENTIENCQFSEKNIDYVELSTLDSLRRGVFAKKNLVVGQDLDLSDIYFAIPTQDNQLLSNDWSKLVTWSPLIDIQEGEPIFRYNITKKYSKEVIENIALSAKNLCDLAEVALPNNVDFEISHHYGLDQFNKYGMVMATIINRQYCKKILVLGPGQTNPEHYHKLKEESFYCVYGDVEVTIENEKFQLKSGDLVVIPTLKKHTIYSLNGAIVEEISSTSFTSDSYYTDNQINLNSNRKSRVTVWG